MFQALDVRKLTRRGDISERGALTIHRGTANRSQGPRPTLVLGVDARGAGNDERHEITGGRRARRVAASLATLAVVVEHGLLSHDHR